MQLIPVDGTRLEPMMCVGRPGPKLVSIETGEIKRDKDGTPVFTVPVVVKDGYRASVIDIAVPGEPKGITEGMRIQVVGLVAIAWNMGDRNGISFRAEALLPAPPAHPAKGGDTN
ncbi:SCO3933 family regulatory protein [Streptacidiphilus sp. PAMC 29251]